TTTYEYYPAGGGYALTIPGINPNTGLPYDPSFGVASNELVHEVIRPAGHGQPQSVRTFIYNFGSGTRVVSDPRGVPATTYTLDAYGATKRIEEPNPGGGGGPKVTTMIWAMDQPDAQAVPSHGGADVEMLSQTDALGRTTSYRYDVYGNVIQQTI